MDPRLKEIVDNYDSWKISLDGSFRFHCTECGKCCINREDILLTPRDLCNASKAMNMLPPAFVNAYCECYIGQDSRIPIVRLKPIGSIKRCPLLKDRKCSIHQAKPAVCAMFPVGRAVTIDKDTFKVYSEKDSLWNPLKLEDYNVSLVEFEDAAKKKALAGGILTRSDEQARSLVREFIGSLPGTASYTVTFQ